MRSLAQSSAAVLRCSPLSDPTNAAADLLEARERRAAGYGAFKIKVGLSSPQADAERTRQICRVLQGRPATASSRPTPIRVFPSTRRSLYVRAVADCGLDFFEQPVDAHDLPGWRASPPRPKYSIGADEGIHSCDDIERHHARRPPRASA